MERLDSSTHFRFTMPQHPDSLNCRPDWTSSLTAICGPSTCIAKRGCISSTTGSSSPPLPGLGSLLASLMIRMIRKGQNPNREPSRHKTKNTKPCNAYNIVKYAKDFKKGNTIMKNYGDPQIQMCRIGGFLSDMYNDARLLNLTMDEHKPGNLAQIHDEVMKILECMAHARWHNACIGGYPIPFCCETATVRKMYTMEEL